MAGTYTIFDDPSATTGTAIASGLNDLDKIVGSYQAGSATHGFLYLGGNFTTIDDPSAANTMPSGINKWGSDRRFIHGLQRHSWLSSRHQWHLHHAR
jgi:hypothetical protein